MNIPKIASLSLLAGIQTGMLFDIGKLQDAYVIDAWLWIMCFCILFGAWGAGYMSRKYEGESVLIEDVKKLLGGGNDEK